MPFVLTSLTVENFKSYFGRTVIGPLKKMNAIIGPNGTGKSNLMDAIAFVLGDKLAAMRVTELSQLINEEAVIKRSYVSMVFVSKNNAENDDEESINMHRIIEDNTSKFFFNNVELDYEDYLSELKFRNINVKAKNMLFYQGAISAIIQDGPKELSRILEEASGSIEFKERYDLHKREMLEARQVLANELDQRKRICVERKALMSQVAATDKYVEHQEPLNRKLVEQQLHRLYHHELEMNKLLEEYNNQKNKFDGIVQDLNGINVEWKHMRKKKGEFERQVNIFEEERVVLKKKMETTIREALKFEEQQEYLRKKCERNNAAFRENKQMYENHLAAIKALENELNAISARRKECAQKLKQNEASIQLNQDDHLEYLHLKQQASRENATHALELETLSTEQKNDQDKLDNLFRHRNMTVADLQLQHSRLEELNNSIKKSRATICNTAREAIEKVREIRGRDNEMKELRKLTGLEGQLEEIELKLSSASLSAHEEKYRATKQETLMRLKDLFPGIFDRLVNLCQPVHARYNVALTKCFGKLMDAIVVTKKDTAIKCIAFLKQAQLAPEIFLPLDYIMTSRVKTYLRNLREPKGVKLIFDIVKFEPPEIKQAVVFACRNMMVCETPEDAKYVAFDNTDQKTYSAIALDGTCYFKTGLISGGAADLEAKAKKWDEKSIEELNKQKKTLLKDIKLVDSIPQKQTVINELKIEIAYMTKIVEATRIQVEADMKTLREFKVPTIQKVCEAFDAKIREVTTRMESRKLEIDELKTSQSKIDDKVFANFCVKINVSNIRDYENSELEPTNKLKELLLELDKKYSKIVANLEFQKSLNVTEILKRSEAASLKAKNEFELNEKTNGNIRNVLAEEKKQLAELSRLKYEQLEQFQEAVLSLKKSEKMLSNISTLLKKEVEPLLHSLKGRLEAIRLERSEVFKHCMKNNIQIPLLNGSLDDLNASTEDSLQLDLTNLAPRQVVVDYSSLSDAAKYPHEVQSFSDELTQVITNLKSEIEKMPIVDCHAAEKLELLDKQVEAFKTKFANTRRHTKQMECAFEAIKLKRTTQFMNLFDGVSQKINQVYKDFNQNPNAQAFLNVQNQEEPYLEGILFDCIPPIKRFQSLSNLSEGESTLAVLSLIFAMHFIKPSPFCLFDEMDAPLENDNAYKIATFFKECSIQTIVIAFHKSFFVRAQLLIGVSAPPRTGHRSKLVMLDLTSYKRHVRFE